WLSFDAVTRTFSGTPANADVGTVSIDVIASDGNGGTVTDSFDIVIANTNDAPTVANAIPDQNATEDAAFNFQFASNTFSDVDVGDTLTYSAQLAGGGALPAWLSFDAVTRTFSGTPANADVGTVSIDVIANDGNGSTVTDTFVISVANINDAPTVTNAIPDRDATENSPFNFQFAANTFGDVDVGDTLTYSAQLAGGGALPAWLSFDAVTRTFSGTPTNGDLGSISIDVIANDGNGGIVTDTFDLTVYAGINNLPTVANAIPDQNVIEDSVFNFQFASNTFADVDVGDTLTYSAQSAGGGLLPAWLSFDAATRTFSGIPLNNDVGTFSLEVTADDGRGGTVTDTFVITVSNTNDAPTVANAIPDQNAIEDTAFNFQFALNTFNDVDVGDTLTYSAQLAGGGALPAWLSFDAVTRTFSGTPANADVGSISIDVIADDGNGGTVT
ncbi:putative Ig domain-containing protein, partial [Cellvibrio sp. OA-2007]